MPCTSSAVTSWRTSGRIAPAKTLMSGRPASSQILRAFFSVSDSGTLPATAVMPRISSSGLAERQQDGDGVVLAGVGVDDDLRAVGHFISLDKSGVCGAAQTLELGGGADHISTCGKNAIRVFPLYVARRGHGNMSRMTPFSSPLLLGFDAMEKTLERLAKIWRRLSALQHRAPSRRRRRRPRSCASRSRWRVSPTTISRSPIEENQLVVRGRQADDTEREFLHRGIAARQFQRMLRAGGRHAVTAAELKNGLLCDRPRPSGTREAGTENKHFGERLSPVLPETIPVMNRNSWLYGGLVHWDAPQTGGSHDQTRRHQRHRGRFRPSWRGHGCLSAGKSAATN